MIGYNNEQENITRIYFNLIFFGSKKIASICISLKKKRSFQQVNAN